MAKGARQYGAFPITRTGARWLDDRKWADFDITSRECDTQDHFPVPIDEHGVEQWNITFLARMRREYREKKWPWGSAAELMFRALIRSLNLHHFENELVQLAKPRPGRKQEHELADRIWHLRSQGKTVSQMIAIFAAEGKHYSRETIESYLKTRRKKPRK